MNIIVIGSYEEWCFYSWEYYRKKQKNFKFDSMKTISKRRLVNKIYKAHFSLKVNKSFKIPFKNIWYKKIVTKLGINNESLIFFYDWNALSADFLFQKYLKKVFPKAKTVYLFTNLVELSGAFKYGYVDKLNRYYDYVVAFDKLDANRFGYCYHPLIFKLDSSVHDAQKAMEYDLCFCGKAKTENRLEQIHEVYQKAINEKLNVWFLIHGVSQEKQINGSNIIYNQTIGFGQLLDIIYKSRCIVDITQDKSTALPLNIVESIVLNKKLITNNQEIKNYDFYNKANVLISSEDDDYCLFLKHELYPYTKEAADLFSLKSLIESVGLDPALYGVC